jgi:putative molybdopterin biosynthesis protein
MAEKYTQARAARIAAGLSQSELARKAGISRQALGAIEAGLYLPNVDVALKLARELGATVEKLFGAEDEPVVEAHLLRHETPRPGDRVVLGRVGARLMVLTRPVAALRLAPASGLIERVNRNRATVRSFRSREEIDSTLLIAGCDPAVEVLGAWLARRRPPIDLGVVPCSSREALDAVLTQQVHAAGVHLRDPRTGSYNLAPVRQAAGTKRVMMVNFARWELGIATAAGNRKSIKSWSDLARPEVRIINRARGAGARSVLDEGLSALGIDPSMVAGYGNEAAGHLEVAEAVATGWADAGVTIRIAAEAFKLDFVPMVEERYDLVIMQSEAQSTAVKALMDALNSTTFTRELAELCFYDVGDTGRLLGPEG